MVNWQGVRDMIYKVHPNSPGGSPTNPLGLRFIDKSNLSNWWAELYAGLVQGNANDTGTPALIANDHFIVRRDSYFRGPAAFFEGGLTLYGNGPDAVQLPDGAEPWKTGWLVGWGPRVGTPFIYLAWGGNRNSYGLGGNHNAETLLITTNNYGLNSPGIDSYYDFANIECYHVIGRGDVQAHRDLFCYRNAFINALRKQNAAWNHIFIWDSLVPPADGTVGKPAEVNLGTPTQKWVMYQNG
jgi:hypothetical protein